MAPGRRRLQRSAESPQDAIEAWAPAFAGATEWTDVIPANSASHRASHPGGDPEGEAGIQEKRSSHGRSTLSDCPAAAKTIRFALSPAGPGSWNPAGSAVDFEKQMLRRCAPSRGMPKGQHDTNGAPLPICHSETPEGGKESAVDFEKQMLRRYAPQQDKTVASGR